jgi:hypothetical protein
LIEAQLLLLIDASLFLFFCFKNKYFVYLFLIKLHFYFILEKYG